MFSLVRIFLLLRILLGWISLLFTIVDIYENVEFEPCLCQSSFTTLRLSSMRTQRSRPNFSRRQTDLRPCALTSLEICYCHSELLRSQLDFMVERAASAVGKESSSLGSESGWSWTMALMFYSATVTILFCMWLAMGKPKRSLGKNSYKTMVVLGSGTLSQSRHLECCAGLNGPIEMVLTEYCCWFHQEDTRPRCSSS